MALAPNQTIMAPMTYAERIAAADAAGLVTHVDTAQHLGSQVIMAPMTYAERIAAADAVDEGVEEGLDEGWDEGSDYPYFAPSFYEQHKTKIFIVGGVAAVLLIGGGALAARRAGGRT